MSGALMLQERTLDNLKLQWLIFLRTQPCCLYKEEASEQEPKRLIFPLNEKRVVPMEQYLIQKTRVTDQIAKMVCIVKIKIFIVGGEHGEN
ncbi:MAG: hypothetical protein JKP96_07040 [Oceanicaulis sp.]|jgi:hypothetical protein|nr:MAG: hypothetical protein N838_30220 [Thiohalocapsa sp. PB-PSB1]MBL4538411.1 hypothetical protein [Oceanicaulis sp.]